MLQSRKGFERCRESFQDLKKLLRIFYCDVKLGIQKFLQQQNPN